MKPVTVDILIQCGASKEGARKFASLFAELLPYYQITTLNRAAHFFAQVLHESNGFRAVEEYASGAAYEGRVDLGNIYPGDGKRYKGRGLVQCTGRANYTAFAKKFGVDVINHPELLAEPRWAVASALWYWNTRKLNLIADWDATGKRDEKNRPAIEVITRRVNGGLNGYADRIRYFNLCKAALAPLFL